MIQYLYLHCEVTTVSLVSSAFKIGGNRDARINKRQPHFQATCNSVGEITQL